MSMIGPGLPAMSVASSTRPTQEAAQSGAARQSNGSEGASEQKGKTLTLVQPPVNAPTKVQDQGTAPAQPNPGPNRVDAVSAFQVAELGREAEKATPDGGGARGKDTPITGDTLGETVSNFEITKQAKDKHEAVRGIERVIQAKLESTDARAERAEEQTEAKAVSEARSREAPDFEQKRQARQDAAENFASAKETFSAPDASTMTKVA